MREPHDGKGCLIALLLVLLFWICVAILIKYFFQT